MVARLRFDCGMIQFLQSNQIRLVKAFRTRSDARRQDAPFYARWTALAELLAYLWTRARARSSHQCLRSAGETLAAGESAAGSPLRGAGVAETNVGLKSGAPWPLAFGRRRLAQAWRRCATHEL